jgi:histidinol-phosphate aminotransferase
MAVAALEQDEGWVRETVERTTVNRERLAEALIALGLKCWPSETNFLLVGAPGGDARRFKELLRELDIGVRAFPGIPQAGDCVRITVGPWSLMERFLAAVKELKNDARITI